MRCRGFNYQVAAKRSFCGPVAGFSGAQHSGYALLQIRQNGLDRVRNSGICDHPKGSAAQGTAGIRKGDLACCVKKRLALATNRSLRCDLRHMVYALVCALVYALVYTLVRSVGTPDFPTIYQLARRSRILRNGFSTIR